MDALVWTLRTFDSFSLAWPVALNLLACLLVAQHDFPLLLAHWLWKNATGRGDTFVPGAAGSRPAGLVIIPSLLRDRDDFVAITTTLESCATNGYPSELLIVASVDGSNDNPTLFRELCTWVEAHKFASHVHLYVASSAERHGKMMAVDQGVRLVERLVASGAHGAFPELYFSIDGDGTLSKHALERLAARLTTPHPLTGNFRRVVSGKICIRPDVFWRGWRALFSVEGQIFMNVAREFLVSNVARSNWKWSPMIGIPGALYCTWRDVLVEAPRYMGFMQSIRFGDVARWWLGGAPPAYSRSDAKPLPEALTGASDDTCIAFIASIASWQNGRLSFDAPRTPLHAFARLLRGYIWERSHDYEPEARVYTYTPSTVKGLWKQRVRWNSSRLECAGRFWRAFWFHWEIGFPVNSHLLLVLQTVFEVSLYYVALPYYCLGAGHAMVGYALGYGAQLIAYSLYSLFALVMEREYRQFWRVLLCLPVAPLYCIAINFFGCVNGVVRDIFFFGNATNFAPEHTLRNGRTERIALLFRARRFVGLCMRSAWRGDVPFGAFWFGWQATPWTPSGYDGWTTGKKPRSMFTATRTNATSMRPLAAARLPPKRATLFRSPVGSALSAAMLLSAGCRATASLEQGPRDESDAQTSVVGTLTRSRSNRFVAVPSERMCVTDGHIGTLTEDALYVDGPEMRAEVASSPVRRAELRFVYRGASAEIVQLASGETRRQIGLKLRANDPCNVVYIMWHIDPSPGVFVSVKVNPGQSRHEDCHADGYLNLQGAVATHVLSQIQPGELHVLRAEEGAHHLLQVFADDGLAWQGYLPPVVDSIEGPAGARSDNGAFDFQLLVANDVTFLPHCLHGGPP